MYSHARAKTRSPAYQKRRGVTFFVSSPISKPFLANALRNRVNALFVANAESDAL